MMEKTLSDEIQCYDDSLVKIYMRVSCLERHRDKIG